MRLFTATLIALAATTLPACGEHDPADATTVVQGFLQAAARDDADAMCARLNNRARVDLEREAGIQDDCRAAAESLVAGPRRHAWRAAAHGSVDVAESAGLANAVVTVSYPYRGEHWRDSGSVLPKFTGGYEISDPPVPGSLARSG